MAIQHGFVHWPHFLQILGRIIENKQYSDDEIQDTVKKLYRNFNHMVQLFINNFIKSDQRPIGKVDDIFYRVKLQQSLI